MVADKASKALRTAAAEQSRARLAQSSSTTSRAAAMEDTRKEHTGGEEEPQKKVQMLGSSSVLTGRPRRSSFSLGSLPYTGLAASAGLIHSEPSAGQQQQETSSAEQQQEEEEEQAAAKQSCEIEAEMQRTMRAARSPLGAQGRSSPPPAAPRAQARLGDEPAIQAEASVSSTEKQEASGLSSPHTTLAVCVPARAGNDVVASASLRRAEAESGPAWRKDEFATKSPDTCAEQIAEEAAGAVEAKAAESGAGWEHQTSVSGHATDGNGRCLNILEPLCDPIPANGIAAEQLHRQIQSGGCLLVTSINSRRVSHVSENVLSVLGLEPAAILTHPLAELVGEEDAQALFQGAEEALEVETKRRARFNGHNEDEATAEEQDFQPTLDAIKRGDFPMRELKGGHFARHVYINGKQFIVSACIPNKHHYSMSMDVFPAIAPPMSTQEMGKLLTELEEDLGESNNLYQGSQLLIERVNSVLKYDRAVVYRMWLPDHHAETVAEERRINDLYPFLGLKFPPQSQEDRDAYVDLRMRLLFDTTTFPSQVIGSFDPSLKPISVTSPGGTLMTIFSDSKVPVAAQASSSPVREQWSPEMRASSRLSRSEAKEERDRQSQRHREEQRSDRYNLNLTRSFLRNSAPAYINLLRSLGIRGSMSVPVVIGRQLHGVLAFYSVRNHKAWSWEAWQFVMAAEAIYSRWLRRQEQKTRQLQEEQLRDMSVRISKSLRHQLEVEPHGFLSLLMFGHPDLCEIAGADTFAFVCEDDWLRVGALPPHTWMQQFVRWFEGEAENQQAATRVEGWGCEKVWSTVNLSHDYPGPSVDPRLAAGALCLLLRRSPLTAFMMFRVETKSAEVWDGVDTMGQKSSSEASPTAGATNPLQGALSVAELSARQYHSAFAAQFLRAFNLSTHGSCAPWPINAYPLLRIVTVAIAEHCQTHDSKEFGQSNLRNLSKHVTPENSLPSRLLREEMDGLLLLSRHCPRAHPVAGSGDAMEERGGARVGSGNDRAVCVNQGWCEVFGFVDETADLADHDIEKCLATAGVPLAEVMHPLFDTSRTISVWSKKKGHTTLLFKSFHVFSIQLDETFQEVLAFTFADVTIQQRVEQALLLAHQQSRRSEQAKQAMIGMVSHELRTPLTAILGFSEILSNDTRLTSEQRDFVNDIHSAGSHLLSIITNLLDLTKFELGDSNKQLCNISSIVCEAALWLQKALDNKMITLNVLLPVHDKDEEGETPPPGGGAAAASEQQREQQPQQAQQVQAQAGASSSSAAAGLKGASIRYVQFVHQPTAQSRNRPGDSGPLQLRGGASVSTSSNGGESLSSQFKRHDIVPLYVMGDAVSLKRVLINLLDNSTKFTPMLGSITVAVRALPPLIPTQQGVLEISVRDSGIGMTPQILSKIWEPFYQADLTAQRELGGAGLGLAMVKSIVELHDGTVTVESEPGAGSKFTISLPVADPAHPRLRSPADATAALIRLRARTMSPTSARSAGVSPRTGLLPPAPRVPRPVRRPVFSPPRMQPLAEHEAENIRPSIRSAPSPAPEKSPSAPWPQLRRHHSASAGARAPGRGGRIPTRVASPPLSRSTQPARRSLPGSPESERKESSVSAAPVTRVARARAAPSSSTLGIPELSSPAVEGAVSLSDDEATEKRKIGERYAVRDDDVEPLKPPAIPAIDVREGLSDEQMRQRMKENLPSPQSVQVHKMAPALEAMIPSAHGAGLPVQSSPLAAASAALAATASKPSPPAIAAFTSPTPADATSGSSSSRVKPSYPDIRIMVVDDSDVNKKLFLRLLAMEGFTNVETASHGLECVEKMMLFKEQTLMRWKKWMEIEHGDVAAKQFFGDLQRSPENADRLSERISMEAAILTQALLSELGVAGTPYAELSDHQKLCLLIQTSNKLVAKEVQSLPEQKIDEMTVSARFAALNLSEEGEDLEQAAKSVQSDQPSMRPAAATESISSPATSSPRGDVRSRPMVSITAVPPSLRVPCSMSPLIPKLIFLDLPHLDGFQTSLALRKLGFDTPIAALTASVGTSDQRMAEALGFQMYLTKPISRAQLKEALDIAKQQANKGEEFKQRAKEAQQRRQQQAAMTTSAQPAAAAAAASSLQVPAYSPSPQAVSGVITPSPQPQQQEPHA